MSWMLDKEIRRELPKDWEGIVPTDVFIREAETTVEEAEKKSMLLRIMGGLGVAIHCQEFRDLAMKLSRTGTGVVKGQEYSDIDFMSYRRHRNKIKDFFSKRGYAKRRATLSSAASERQIYYHPKGWFYVDVFYDKLLVANHPLDLRKRLELDYPTISITDLLLEKIQMWEAFSVKDLKDCLILLRAHKVKEGEGKEQIDATYMAELLSKDWGFWYTATTNLEKIKRFISEISRFATEVEIDPGEFAKEDIEDIVVKIETLLKRVNEEPKSFKWKIRSRVGTTKRWYNPVEREETVGGFGIWDAILPKE